MCELLQQSLALWAEAAGGDDPSGLPLFGRTFTPVEQAARETLLDRFLDTIESELRQMPRTRAERSSARARVTSGFTDFARTCLDLDDGHLDLLLNDGFSAVATQLARQARLFDPAVSAADIFQASRNAWTACGLQILMGQKMRLTPAIFAYSMLYPYTDNYLDDPEISRAAKLAFSSRFRRRLEGDAVAPLNDREALIWRLVELIEEQYARDAWPGVHASLLEIHRAQENSVRLLRFGSSPAGADVLKLSFEKGGASVVADAHLVAASLSPDEARFAFDWGVLLQLADDLQDLQQDLRERTLTIFTQALAAAPEAAPVAGRLDKLTAHTFNFGHRVMRQLDRMPSNLSALDGAAARHRSLAEMIRMSCSLLLIWSAGESAALYTPGYIAALETHSPFRFAPLAERRKKLARWTAPLGRLFDAFLEDEEDEPAPLLLASSLMPRL
ncbi:MAG TPA: hypothetical protein VLY23_00055 [Candidatus Acidoferrum sp.]|nr:hypothetical protein [Candidatus Acidoferrum sp.]